MTRYSKGDTPIAGVTVEITDSLGGKHKVTTDKDGKYSKILPEGVATVRVVETSNAINGAKRTAGDNPCFESQRGSR